MSLDLFPAESQKGEKATKAKSFFLLRGLLNSGKDLTEEQLASQNTVSRCERCGFPLNLRREKVRSRKIFTKKNQGNLEKAEKSSNYSSCLICRREKILNFVLITSYIIAAGLFIASFVGVLLDQLNLDVSLMILCLEVILLLFFGRFLEEGVFFGLTEKEKILAGLSRFSITGEIQAYDVAMDHMKHLAEEELDSKIIEGIIQVISLQFLNLPENWYEKISYELGVTEELLLKKLSSEIDNPEGRSNFENTLKRTTPEGLSALTSICINANNFIALEMISNRLMQELEKDQPEKEWLEEIFINQKEFEKAFLIISKEENVRKMEEALERFTPPKVPSIDAVAEGKSILQKYPTLAYLLRILFYILLSLLLGLLYRLFY